MKPPLRFGLERGAARISIDAPEEDEGAVSGGYADIGELVGMGATIGS